MMRVMVIVKANEQTEAGEMPSEELLTAMGKFNEELVESGIMKAGEGIQPSSNGARVIFSNSDRSVVHGPFANPEELVAGFWIWEVESMEHAIKIAKRIPFVQHNGSPDQGVVEIRPVFEADDFGEEFTDEERAREDRMRQDLGMNS